MLVLNIQFWEGDKDQAMKLARLLADIEPMKREDVVVLFSARFDCSHDPETIGYVSQKFNVSTYKSTYKATGWPAGPNWLMANSYQHCIERMRSNQMKGDAVLFIEADCIPLARDWINQLIAEYKACGKMILGYHHMGNDGCNEHINGNCIIHKDFWRTYRPILSPTKIAWDADHAGAMLPNSAPSKLIWSDYQLGMKHNPWRGCDFVFEEKEYTDPRHPLYGQVVKPVWFHGIKGGMGIDCARERLVK